MLPISYKWIKKGVLRPSSKIPTSLRLAGNGHTLDLRETEERLLEVLIPDDTNSDETHQKKELRLEIGIDLNNINPISDDDVNHIRLCDKVEVKAAIWRTDPRKAPGHDGINGEILRKAWPMLAESIIHIFNCTLRTGTFPSRWKNADLCIINKGPTKDPLEAKSYRPICLLPVISKALEHIIVDRLRDELDSRLSVKQYGFTRGKTTVDAIHLLN